MQNYYLGNRLSLETFLNGVGGGLEICRDDEKHSFVYISEAAAAIQGYTIDELMEVSGGNAVGNIYPMDLGNVLSSIQRQLAKGDTYICKYRVRHKDGNLRWVAKSGRRAAEEGVVFHYSLLQDVTKLEEQNKEIKNTLALLNQERKRYRDALTSNCVYSYSSDVTEGLIYLKSLKLHGIDMLEKFDFKQPVSFDRMDEIWREMWNPKLLDGAVRLTRDVMLEQFRQGNRTVETEYYSAKMDTYTRVTILLSQNEQNGHIYGFLIAHDTTKMRRSEAKKRRDLLEAKKALEDAYEAANRASAAKTDFLSRMSHDIRTPMNAIIGMTAIAGKHLEDKGRVADCLNKIMVSSKYLLGVINEVLDMSKIESGKLDLNEEEFSLFGLIDNLFTMSKPQFGEKKQTFTISVRDVAHEQVIGDSQRIQQALMNLVGNAIKYTPEGGTVDLSLTEKKTNKPMIGCYEFIIADNGIGMDEEFQKRLFEPFVRAEDTRVEKMQGTGLGMAITKNIVQMMNGTLKVESAPEVGTKITMTVFFKLQTPDGAAHYEKSATLPGSAVHDNPDVLASFSEKLFAGKRALVVEDNEINVEVASEILGMAGFVMEYARNGKEAVDAMAEAADGYYDVVFMDVQMPVMNGYEATKAIRALGRDYTDSVPIIAMTANAFAEDVRMAKGSGMNEHVTKPLDFGQLMAVLRKWLAA